MESIYFWPDHPMASLATLWLASVVFLWAARDSMLELLGSLGGGLADGLASLASRTRETADELGRRGREILLAAGTRDAQGRLDRELERLDTGLTEQLGQYSSLQRRLDEQLLALDNDYQQCAIAPPAIPGWSAAVETIAGLPTNGDPNIQKVLEGIKRSSKDAEQKALSAYRDDSAKRHKVMGKMLPYWKEIRTLLTRMNDSVSHALESTTKIHGLFEDYAAVRNEHGEAARALTFSAWKFFLISAFVLAIAFGGAFINFQLIALPMSELVPAGARVGGMPVATISALILVLMEAALGIFLMDMLGITEFFPRLTTLPRQRRKLVLWLAIAGLFFLASVESSLAILREQIVEADAALKLSLASEEMRIVQSASESSIPMIGQAVLGFVLPWVLALVAVPLEMLLENGRHAGASVLIALMRGTAVVLESGSHVARHLTGIFTNLYDVYVAIPLRIERAVAHARGDDIEDARPKRSTRKNPTPPPTPRKSLA